jgi:large repetitive protein
MKSFFRVILLSLAFVFAFTTCENPVGLGMKVNTEKPVIRNAADGDQPGAFIQGDSNRIWLEVEQEFGIDDVFMEVSYTNKFTGEKIEKEKVQAYQDKETGKWFVDLDTSKMVDGKISTWVTAVDVNGNATTTTEIPYFVKNTPPQIKLNMPLVDGDDWDNIKKVTEKGEAYFSLDELKKNDPLYLGFELLGLATDDFGIALGYPKIMIWPDEGPTNLDVDGIPFPDNKLYGSWYPLDVPNKRDGLTATKFSWPMKVLKLKEDGSGDYRVPNKDEDSDSLPEGNYRVRIVTKDSFGNENYYPNRTDRGSGGQFGEFGPSRKYFVINYKVSEVPVVQVTDAPQYYNGVEDFDVYLTVSSISKITNLVAYITDGQDGYEENIAGPYNLSNFTDLGESNSAYKYKLTITPAEAALWPSRIQTIVNANPDSPAKKGLVYVKVKAEAGERKGKYSYQNFIFDNSAPDIVIDRPVNLLNSIAKEKFTGGSYEILYPDNERPKWVTGSITVGGSAKDNYTLSSVWYHLGKLGDDNATAAQREAIYANAANWVDTELDKTKPIEGWEGSVYAWTYSFKPFDKDYKTTLGLSLIQETDALISFPANDRNETKVDEDHPNRVRFYLPFYVKVVDTAGNYSVLHYKLSVDPLLDEPNITVTQPERKKDTAGKPIPGDAGRPIVGGTVRVAGFAEDNFWMHTVLVRVRKSNNTYYLPHTEPVTTYFYPASDYPIPPPAVGTDGWFKASTIGDSNNINWYTNINQLRDLEPGNPGETVPVTVEVMAIDCDESDPTHQKTHMTGPVEKWDLLFSKDVPTITKPIIRKDGVDDRIWADGIKASGKFQVIFDVGAISHINTLTVRVNAELVNLVIDTNKQDVNSTAWNVSNTSFADEFEQRTITLTIDSMLTLIPGFSTVNGFPIGGTGNLILEVMAEDATTNHLTTTSIFTIGIDNLYPTATITTPQIASDSLVTGKEKYFFVEGEAKDYTGTAAATVQGLERVLVLFERGQINGTGAARTVTGNGTFVNPYNGSDITDAALGTGFRVYPNVLDPIVSTTTTSSYEKFPRLTSVTNADKSITWKSASALVIDRNEGAAPTADGDGDGTYGETWTTPPALKNFGARVQFQGPGISWKDGPYIIHYLIVDEAGNATHYYNKYDIYLENNKPHITSINFGTDINGVGGAGNVGNVTDGSNGTLNEYLYYDTATGIAKNEAISEPTVSSAAGVMSPSFRIRGNRFNVKFDVEKGNGTKGATVSYVSGTATGSASLMTKGNVYTIVSLGSNMTDFTKYGAPNNVPGTTFIASGPAPATTDGTVTSYTLINRLNQTMSDTDTSGTLSFQNFTGVLDSDKYVAGDTPPVGSEIGDVKTHNQRSFIVKVFDNTVSGAPGGENDQLADAILVRVDIDNTDSKNPTINVLPFGEEYYIDTSDPRPGMNNPANDKAKIQRRFEDIPNVDISKEYLRNIGMNGTAKGGYVQYARHSTPATANISGKVKFLGKVEDNQKIAGIYVTITNYTGGAGVGTQFQIAQANGTTGNLEAVAPGTNFAGQWEFKVLDNNRNYFTLDYGHTLNWEFMWDSSKVNNTAGAPGTSNNPVRNNVTITFQVRDAAARNANSPMTVNVVPYITEVKTPLSGAYSSNPSAFNRSALGGYPVREGDEITISGFNFGTNNATVNGTALSPTTTTGGNTIKGTVPTTATSGPLVVSVNNGTETITSFNNRSNRNKDGNNWDSPYSAEYNREPNGVNNNILDNSRYVYVWSTGNIYPATAGNNQNSLTPANARSPFMRMDNNANRYIAYGYHDGTNSHLYAVKNLTYTNVEREVNRYINNTIAFDAYGDWYIASSNITSSANYYFNFYAREATNGTDANHNNEQRNNKRRLSVVGSNSDRFKIPRIDVMHTAATGARGTNALADRIYMSYYDSNDADLVFHFGTVGTTSGTPSNTILGQNFAGEANNFAAPTKQLVVDHTRTTDTHKGSIYSAVGHLSNGRPVIAWYDDTNACLVFSYGNALTGNVTTYDGNNISTTNTQTWQSNARRITPVGSGKGQHVDMVVDGDNVHLAYYDVNNGGLYYTYIPSANVPNNNTINPETAPIKVDTYLSAGTKLMLNVRGGIPYISYYHGAFTDTKNSIRVAWRKSTNEYAAGMDENDKFMGNWEVMTVPVGTVPSPGEFICNGVPTGTTAWTTGNRPTGSTITIYSDLDKSILLSYLTTSWYEGAVLKDNMTSSWATLTGK